MKRLTPALFVEKIEPDRLMQLPYGAAAVAAVLYPLQGVSNGAMEPAPIRARASFGAKGVVA